MRDRDVRNAITQALLDTHEFNDVSTPASDAGSPASEQAFATVEPAGAKVTQHSDAYPDGYLLVESKCTITISYRHIDPNQRDDNVERLIAVACNTVNGNNFGGLINEQTALLSAWQWQPVTTPDRRIAATFSYEYLVDGWRSFDTSE